MNESEFQFRTAAFGGFQKQDVLSYLEQSARDHAEKADALRRELEEARQACQDGEAREAALTAQVDSLREEGEKLSDTLADRDGTLAEQERALAEAREQIARLEGQCQALQAEVDRLTPVARAYEGVKDRTAGMELEAHGRAQLIERQARERARRTQDRAEEWFGRLSERYDSLRTQLDQAVEEAAGQLAQVEEVLRRLPEELAAPEGELKELGEALKTMDGPRPPAPLPMEEGEN